MAVETTTIRVTADTKDAERALGNLQSSLRNLVTIGAATALAAQFVSIADAATVLSNKMRTVTNSSADAGIAFADVIRISKLTGMEVSAVGDLFQKVSLAGNQMGLSVKDAALITENFTKALAVTGTVGPAATSAIYQFGQALGRGTVVFEDMKQLQESSAGTLELIAKQFGKTSQQFLKDVQAGRVGSNDLAAALKQLGDTVNPTFGGMQKTVGQSLNSVKANFIDLMNKFENATGTFDKIAKGIGFIGDNLNIVIPLAAGLIGAFAAARLVAIISGLAQMAIAIRTIGTTAAVAQALATGGLSAIAAAAGATAAYLAADKLFADLEKNDALKKQADEANRLKEEADKAGKNIKALQYAGPIIDQKALRESAATFTEQTRLMSSMIGLGKQRAEQEKAVADFAREQKVTYDKIKNTRAAADIRAAIAQRQNAEAVFQAQSDLISIEAQKLALKEKDSRAAQGLLIFDRLRVQYGTTLSEKSQIALARAEVELRVQQDTVKIKRDNVNAQNLLNDFQQNMLTNSSVELDIKQQILSVQQTLGYRISDDLSKEIAITEQNRKRLDLLKQIKSAVEGVNQPLGGLAAGAAAAGQLGQLDPIRAAETQNATLLEGLQVLKDQQLISEQQYQTARVSAEVQANSSIMQARQEMFERTKQFELQSQKASIFGYETQKQIAQESARFQMKSEMEKSQFALEQAGQMFSALGAQNRKAFEAAKAFNIANAIMNTYMAATKAMASYPFPFSLIAAGAAVTMGLAQVAQIRSQNYSGRQLGGPVMAGQSYIVGETSPEIFTPSTTGRIDRLDSLGGGGGPVNVTFNIVANDTAGFDDLLLSRRGLIRSVISDAMLESGRRG